MNNEQKFYKKHPIITAIFIALVGAAASWRVTSSLNNPPLYVIQKEQVINNTYNNTYTIMNIGPNEVSGLLNINANKNDSFKSINVIKGDQYTTLSKVQDISGTVKFDIPKGETVVVATASDNVVASSVELDAWYEKLKKRIANLFKANQSKTSKN
jgi:hypothetical protein